MPKNFDRVVSAQHFVSAKRVHEDADRREDSLARIVRKLLQRDARTAVAAGSIAVLIDSSGGTAGAIYQSVADLTETDNTSTTNGVLAASLDTSADTVMNAYREILNKCTLVLDTALGLGTVDEGPGGAPNTTIEAIDATIAANTGDGDAVTFVSANAVVADLLHTQRHCINAVDDARESVGLARIFPRPGIGTYVFGTAETLVFADANPDTLTRDVGSWAADGFLENDQIRIVGTNLNDIGPAQGGRFTIASMTALVLTLVATDTFVAESLTAAEAAVTSIRVEKPAAFPGRLGGADTLDIDGTTTQGGNNWVLVFETGTSSITDAAAGDITKSALKTELDALIAELADNVAFLADNVDAATQVAQSAPLVGAVSR